jgi:hypothetical protein
MRAERRWLLWRWEWVEARGQWAKVPRQPNGKHADPTDPLTWTAFETVVRALSDSQVPGGPFSGIGFALGDGWTGADLDSCRDPETGEIQASSRDIISTINSYTEISPTGTGAKIFAYGTLPPGRRKSRGGDVELYDAVRYFAVTGIHLEGTPRSVQERTAQLADVHARYVVDEKRYDLDQRTGSKLQDDDLLERARRARDGLAFSQLFEGQWVGSYESQSAADAALVRKLFFWTRGDRAQIDRIFRRSGLFRLKWDERRGSSTYGYETISEIIKSKGEVYSGRPSRAHVRDTINRIGQFSSMLGRGTSTGTDRAVLLVLLDCALRIGSLEFGASVRWLAETAGIHPGTAMRSLQRLVDRDLLLRVERSDGPHATRWKLQPPPICARLRPVDMHREEETKTVAQTHKFSVYRRASLTQVPIQGMTLGDGGQWARRSISSMSDLARSLFRRMR